MKQSAGILLYKYHSHDLWVFLAHPGGPFWKNQDLGSWSIPKGEFDDDENAFDAALREFQEETGFSVSGEFIELAPVKMKSNKVIHAWACEQDIDAALIQSNLFELEWPPKSGKMASFPEIDRAEWFTIEEALLKIHVSQVPLLNELVEKLEA